VRSGVQVGSVLVCESCEVMLQVGSALVKEDTEAFKVVHVDPQEVRDLDFASDASNVLTASALRLRDWTSNYTEQNKRYLRWMRLLYPVVWFHAVKQD